MIICSILLKLRVCEVKKPWMVSLFELTGRNSDNIAHSLLGRMDRVPRQRERERNDLLIHYWSKTLKVERLRWLKRKLPFIKWRNSKAERARTGVMLSVEAWLIIWVTASAAVSKQDVVEQQKISNAFKWLIIVN